MENFLSLDAVYIAFVFVVPGYIISCFRGHFVTGRKPNGPDYFVRLLTLSGLNFTIAGWAIFLALAWDTGATTRALIWVFVLGISPVLIGIVSGLGSQREWVRKLYNLLGQSPLHYIPTSWDFQFSRQAEWWVLVVLKDDTKFAGYWSGNSFASSEPDERDILIERLYDIPDGGQWTPTNKSVLIGSGQIRSIEFIPVERRVE